MQVSAIIVTRGDVDLHPVLDSLPEEWEVLVWNNERGYLRRMFWNGDWWQKDMSVADADVSDLSVYGRYAAIDYASHDVIYVQDDDCVLSNPANVVAAYVPGVVTFNMPYAFRDSGLDSVMVGFGACFDKRLPQKAFDRFELAHGYHSVHNSDLFNRNCDMVFTTLTPWKMMHEPVELLDYSYAANRMWQQPEQQQERRMVHEIALEA